MANFLAVWDPVDHRRRSCVDRAGSELHLVPGLEAGIAANGDLAVAWTANPHAPVDAAVDDATGAVTAVWGDALAEGSGRRTGAEELARRSGGPEGGEPPCFDGFHAWLHGGPGIGVVAGADPVGLFPVYWARPAEDVLLVASSIRSFRAHPLFHPVLDPDGVAGVLLTNGLVEGRTLAAGVRRLAAGHVLRWNAAGDAAERPVYAPARRDGLDTLTHGEIVSRTDAVLADAVERHTASYGRFAALLSGGIDSRTMTAYAVSAGRDVTAATLGRDRETEFRCAARVARELGVEHVRIEGRSDRLVEAARLEAKASWLTNGFSGVQGWRLALGPYELPEGLLTGLAGDVVLGLSHVGWGEDGSDGTPSVDAYLRELTRWGVPDEILDGVARPWFREHHVRPISASLAERVVPDAASPVHRIWRSGLRHRHRFHVASAAWRWSFAAWPIIPFTDRRLLDWAASLPVAAMSGRRLQKDVLRSAFPELAVLPVDRNAYRAWPLEPRTRHHVARALEEHRWIAPLVRWWRRRGPERRYYYRTYDLNGPGWRSVRSAAEPLLGHLDEVIDPGALRERYLPAPAEELRVDNGIKDASGRKLFLGLALLSEAAWDGRPEIEGRGD